MILIIIEFIKLILESAILVLYLNKICFFFLNLIQVDIFLINYATAQEKGSKNPSDLAVIRCIFILRFCYTREYNIFAKSSKLK